MLDELGRFTLERVLHALEFGLQQVLQTSTPGTVVGVAATGTGFDFVIRGKAFGAGRAEPRAQGFTVALAFLGLLGVLVGPRSRSK